MARQPHGKARVASQPTPASRLARRGLANQDERRAGNLCRDRHATTNLATMFHRNATVRAVHVRARSGPGKRQQRSAASARKGMVWGGGEMGRQGARTWRWATSKSGAWQGGAPRATRHRKAGRGQVRPGMETQARARGGASLARRRGE